MYDITIVNVIGIAIDFLIFWTRRLVFGLILLILLYN